MRYRLTRARIPSVFFTATLLLGALFSGCTGAPPVADAPSVEAPPEIPEQVEEAVFEIPAPEGVSPFFLQAGHEHPPFAVSHRRNPAAPPEDLAALTFAAADGDGIRIWRGDGVLLDSISLESLGSLESPPPFALLSGGDRLAFLSPDRKRVLVHSIGTPAESELTTDAAPELEGSAKEFFPGVDREILGLVSSSSSLLLLFSGGDALLLDGRTGGVVQNLTFPGDSGDFRTGKEDAPPDREVRGVAAFSSSFPDRGGEIVIVRPGGDMALFSPDPQGRFRGRRVLVQGRDSGGSGERKAREEPENPIAGIAFAAPDLVLLYGENGSLSLWHLSSGPVLSRIRDVEPEGVLRFHVETLPPGEQQPVRLGVIMQPAAGSVGVPGTPGTPGLSGPLRLYTLDPGNPERPPRLYREDPRPASLAFFPIPGGPLYLARIGSRTEQYTNNGSPGSPEAPELMIYDDRQGRILHAFPGPIDTPLDAAFLEAPGGTAPNRIPHPALAILYHNRIEFSDPTGNRLLSLPLDKLPRSILSDGTGGLFLLLSSGELMHLPLTDPEPLQLRSLGTIQEPAGPRQLIYHQDSRHLLMITRQGIEVVHLGEDLNIDHTFRIPLSLLPPELSPETGNILASGVLPDGTLRLLLLEKPPGSLPSPASLDAHLKPSTLTLVDLPGTLISKTQTAQPSETAEPAPRRYVIPHQAQDLQLLPCGTEALVQVRFRRRPVPEEPPVPGYLLLDLESGEMQTLYSTRPGAQLLGAGTSLLAEQLPDPRQVRLRLFPVQGGAPLPVPWVTTASGRDGWVSWSDRGYFAGSAKAGELLALRRSGETSNPVHLASRYLYTSNAPDMMMEIMAHGMLPNTITPEPEPSPEYPWYRVHRLQRTEASGSRQSAPDAKPWSLTRSYPILDAPAPPEVELHSVEHRRITDMKNEIILCFSITPGPAPVAAFQIKVNGVPLFPAPGKQFNPASGAKRVITETIPLYEEFNRVEIIAVDAAGLLSHPCFTWGEVKKAKAGEAWFAGVGISNYGTSGYGTTDYGTTELPFAAKDARDLRIYFDNVIFDRSFALEHQLFTDRNAGPDALEKIEAYFSITASDDIAVLFLAGRSSFSPETGWLFHLPAPHRAITLRRILDIFRTVPARRRLILLDPVESDESPEPVASRSFDELTANRAILTDPLRDPGAWIITSRSSGQRSLSDPALRNRLFAEALLRTLTSRSADTNRNGFIDLPELYQPIRTLVETLSNRRQSPLIVRSNPRTPIFLPAVTDFGVDIPGLLHQSDQGTYQPPKAPSKGIFSW